MVEECGRGGGEGVEGVGVEKMVDGVVERIVEGGRRGVVKRKRYVTCCERGSHKGTL